MESDSYVCDKIDPWYWRFTTKKTDEDFLKLIVQPAIEHFASHNLKTAIILKYNEGTMIVHAIALSQKGQKPKSEQAQQEFKDDLQVRQTQASQWTPTQLSFDT